MYTGSFFDWIEMAKRDEGPSKASDDMAVLVAVIETAADAIDTEGVIRLLCELTDRRKEVAFLMERNVELLELSDRLVAAIDAERADYARILARREQEITDVRDMLDEREKTIAELRGRIERLIAQR